MLQANRRQLWLLCNEQLQAFVQRIKIGPQQSMQVKGPIPPYKPQGGLRNASWLHNFKFRQTQVYP